MSKTWTSRFFLVLTACLTGCGSLRPLQSEGVVLNFAPGAKLSRQEVEAILLLAYSKGVQRVDEIRTTEPAQIPVYGLYVVGDRSTNERVVHETLIDLEHSRLIRTPTPHFALSSPPGPNTEPPLLHSLKIIRIETNSYTLFPSKGENRAVMLRDSIPLSTADQIMALLDLNKITGEASLLARVQDFPSFDWTRPWFLGMGSVQGRFRLAYKCGSQCDTIVEISLKPDHIEVVEASIVVS